MFRKYLGLREYGMDPITSGFSAFLSVLVGQPEDTVVILNVAFKV